LQSRVAFPFIAAQPAECKDSTPVVASTSGK
jgi:hypothetical protein